MRRLTKGLQTESGSRRSSGLARERGSVLVLLIGLVAVVLLLIGVVTDASVLFLTKRSLATVVDGAALAGAQTLDEAAFYNGGPDPADSLHVPLGAGLSEQAVLGYLRNSAAAQSLNKFQVRQVQVSAERVSVTADATAQLPFRRLVGGSAGLRVEATATAETPFR